MDIHFCDLCGVRVTDVDLRGGHGIRKQYDVICATCLELGHGKEWLASHQRGKSASSASQPVAAALAANSSSKQSPVITQARDRVQTFEDGDESPSVAPQVLSADEPEDGTAASELMDELTPAKPTPVPSNAFAAAASSFSALAQSPAKANAGADVDENVEQGEGLSDESAAAPVLADDGNDTDKAAGEAAEGGDSPFGFENKDKPSVAQKDETLPVDREPILAEKSGDKKKSSSSESAAFKKSSAGTKSSSANGKGGKSKSSNKIPVKKVNKNKNILMMSALSIGILTMILLITVKSLKKPKKEQETIHFDMSQDLKDAIKAAKLSATLAYKSKNVEEMKAAKAQIQAIQPKIYNFEKEAKATNKAAWDEDAFGRYLEGVDWPDTQLLIRNLNDEIVKQTNGGTGK
jgi:hypothetical protein